MIMLSKELKGNSTLVSQIFLKVHMIKSIDIFICDFCKKEFKKMYFSAEDMHKEMMENIGFDIPEDDREIEEAR